MKEVQQTASKKNILSIVASGVEKLLVWVSILIGGALMVNMVVAVFFRYVLNRPIFWADELSLYLFCWITFIGACLAVKRTEMAAVTLLLDRFSHTWKRIATVVINLFIIAFSVVVMYYSVIWVSSPSVTNQFSVTIPFLKMWVLYSIVPISMVIMILFALDHMIRVAINGVETDREEELS